MPVPSSITDLALTAIANSPQGTESAKGSIDNYIRTHAAFLAQLNVKAAISPDDFGATGTAVLPGDTVAVQAAFDDGRPVKFTRNYHVDSTVTIGGVGRNVDFNGFSITGIATTAKDAVLHITCRSSNLRNLNVNQNFNTNYAQAIRWHSTSAGAPAQYNKVFGMHITYALHGLTFGQAIGTASIDAAQSENTIYGLTCRGVQVCYTGNQSNGFLTLVAPILDCNPNEWTPLAPGIFDETLARSFNNEIGSLHIIGGEILKTYTQLGYGFEGRDVTTTGTTYEIACSWGNIKGDMTIRDSGIGFMSSDSVSAFVIDAVAGSGRLLLDNFGILRGAGVGSYSASILINGDAAPSYAVALINCTVNEWKTESLVRGCTFNLKNVGVTLDELYVSNDNVNVLSALDPYGNDTFASGAACAAWTPLLGSGGGAFSVKQTAGGVFPECATTIQFTGSGGAVEFFAKFARVVPGKKLHLHAWMQRISGAGNTRFVRTFYDIERVIVGAATTTVMPTTAGEQLRINEIVSVPTGAVWMRINVQLDLDAVVKYSAIRAVMTTENSPYDPNIYGAAAPTVGVWMAGERVYNLSPSVGAPKSWVCTVAGSPGTWVSEGNL